jgi:hypothetical protein
VQRALLALLLLLLLLLTQQHLQDHQVQCLQAAASASVSACALPLAR